MSILPQLTIPPYGEEVFTDRDRQKSFTKLCFRHDGGTRAKVLTWVDAVIADLAAAGIHATGAYEIELRAAKTYPDPPTDKTKWRCHLKVPINL